MDFIKKFFTLLGCIVTIFLFSSCSEDYAIQECDVDAVILSRSSVHEFNDCDSIMPLVGDSITMRKVKLGVLLTNVSNETSEELQQLDQIPVYLQIKGNTSVNQFLSAEGEGKELVFKPFKDKDDSQQFFIKTYSAVMGIPYMIYSKKTNTPISLGSYSSNPSVKVVYAKRGNETSTFGASWDIRNGEYHTDAFIIENQDYPQQGSSGSLYDTFYSVISANDSKVTLEKYQRLPRQEFSIIPVEDFRVESIAHDIFK